MTAPIAPRPEAAPVDTGKPPASHAGAARGRKVPVHRNALTDAANKVGPSDFRRYATFVNGMIGGVLAARLGFRFAGDEKFMTGAA